MKTYFWSWSTHSHENFLEKVKAQGLLLPCHWSAYDGNKTNIYKLRDLSPKDLEGMYQDALGEWYKRKLRNPAWIHSQMRNALRMVSGIGVRGALANVAKISRILTKSTWRRS